MTSLPTALAHEPLIDAIFEVRLSAGAISMADILPGFLTHHFGVKPKLTRLPAADIPQPIRASDPNLPFQTLFRFEAENILVGAGDRAFSVSARMPYRKWPFFRKQILDVVDAVAKIEIDNKVERYSLKYTNLLQGDTREEQLRKIKMSIDIGSLHVSDQDINLQVHNVTDRAIHIITVASSAEVILLTGERLSGTILDIDSIHNIDAVSVGPFAEKLKVDIDHLRNTNKALFFGCLTESTLADFGPIYE